MDPVALFFRCPLGVHPRKPTQLWGCTPEPTQLGESTLEPTQLGLCTPEPTQLRECTPEPTQLQKCTPEPTQFGGMNHRAHPIAEVHPRAHLVGGCTTGLGEQSPAFWGVAPERQLWGANRELKQSRRERKISPIKVLMSPGLTTKLHLCRLNPQ